MDTPNTEKPVTHPHLSQHDRDRLDDDGLTLDTQPAYDDDTEDTK